MIDDPPGDPVTSSRRPAPSITIVGDIELRGRLPGCTRLATGVPSGLRGVNEKSVSWLLSRKPAPGTITPLPKELSTVVVIDSALPYWSTIETWLVPCSVSLRCGDEGSNSPGGSPAVAVP